ncbi:hypothetical protein [Flavobacterium sp. N1994]|uniref:hypothetical protein n=1 Tax=Flavobacterium sp. N1994 TaxID=2986827 RepID=UPI00222331EA|nr:hypothetical protein [Flavobacterium sp. N1994]
MKTVILLSLILSLSFGNAQTQGNATIPTMFVGTWTNAANNDTISITTDKITWTSNDNTVFVSYVDYVLHNDSVIFSFYAYPNVFALSLEKISRVKLIFDAQTQEGYTRRNDLYLKQGTRAN